MRNGKVRYIKYNSEEFQRFEYASLEEIITDESYINWIDIASFDNEELMVMLGEKFDLSPIVIEEIKDTGQIPKVEDYKDYIFIIIEDVIYSDDIRLKTKQLSLILFKDLIITVQENDSQLFDEISTKIEVGAAVRKNNGDYLLYELISTVVDNYFDVLESIGERIDEVEDELLYNPRREILQDIYKLKRDLINIRKTLWLMRNAISTLTKNDYELIEDKTINNFRDIYDHIVQLIDLTETYRDICSGMLDIYLSSISNKTNDIMKVLTIFSTIFIPLTFLAGIYGMNFNNIPELQWKHGYVGFWIVSLIITGFMVRYFRQKKWL